MSNKKIFKFENKIIIDVSSYIKANSLEEAEGKYEDIDEADLLISFLESRNNKELCKLINDKQAFIDCEVADVEEIFDEE